MSPSGSLGLPACTLKLEGSGPGGEWGTAKMQGRSLPNTNPRSRRSWANNRGRRRNKRREGTALDKEEAFLRRNAKSGERGTREPGQVREETDWEASQKQDCHLPEGARSRRSAVRELRGGDPKPGSVANFSQSPQQVPSHPSGTQFLHAQNKGVRLQKSSIPALSALGQGLL